MTIVKRSGRSRGESSSQAMGTDTGAPGRARAENAATEVAVRLFRR